MHKTQRVAKKTYPFVTSQDPIGRAGIGACEGGEGALSLDLWGIPPQIEPVHPSEFLISLHDQSIGTIHRHRHGGEGRPSTGPQ